MVGPVVSQRVSGRGLVRRLFDVGSPEIAPRDLVSDCAEERRLAASIAAHASGMEYPALRESMERVARETSRHAAELEGLLRQHGIEPPVAPEPPGPAGYANMVMNVQTDALAVKERVARYRYVLESGTAEVKRVVEPIYEDKLEHDRLMVEVAMRICR